MAACLGASRAAPKRPQTCSRPACNYPEGPWPEPLSKAVVLPVFGTQQESLSGIAVLGVGPRRVLDDAYRTFFDLIASHIGTAISAARAYEAEQKRAEALVEEALRRLQGEEALRQSEERFRGYLETRADRDGDHFTTPKAGLRSTTRCGDLGYERSELLQMTWAELTHPDDLAADVVKFNQVMAGEIDGYSMDKRCIRKDGQVIDAIISVKCVRRVDGSVDYFVGLLQDVTARKRAEERLLRSNE